LEIVNVVLIRHSEVIVKLHLFFLVLGFFEVLFALAS